MSEPFLAEIKIVGFNFPPRGWALCDGQILPINQNQSLYSLLGTTYGGDGRTSFGLPDLRGRVPLHFGSSGGATYTQGQKGGEEVHALTAAETPAHDHTWQASTSVGDSNRPGGNVLAREPGNVYKASPGSTMSLKGDFVGNTGGGQGHENMQPYLALNFCIALQGLFPSRN